MDCDSEVTVAGGVAFVTLHLRNPTPVARRVRATNRLDGPVLPPRTGGVPDAGWDDAGVTAVVPPETTRPLGYACPLGAHDGNDHAEPAATVVGDDRVADDGDADPETPHDDSTVLVRDAVRDLGRPAPPRDAVPGPNASDRVAEPSERDAATSVQPTEIADEQQTAEANKLQTAEADEQQTPTADADSFPSPIATWLAGVERRVAAAESLDAATGVETATVAVADLEVPPADLASRLATDRRLLAQLAARAECLADRAETASVPTDALQGLS